MANTFASTASLTGMLPDKAEKLAVQVGELLTAGGTLGDALNFTTEDYEAIYALGHDFYRRADYQGAFRLFAYLVMHNHLEIRYVTAFASSLQMLQSWNEAIQYYSMVIAMDMMNPRPMLHVCECLIELQRYAQAREGLVLLIAQSQKIDLPDLQRAAQTLLDFIVDKADAAAPVAAEI